jgi:hypothetical protein
LTLCCRAAKTPVNQRQGDICHEKGLWLGG